jgi:hypothetical protein
MAALIEKTFGRGRLIDCLCDSAALLLSYNEAAARHDTLSGEALALWSSDLLRRIR